MHIPDGMLNAPTVAAAGASSAGFVAYAVAWVRKHFDQRRIVMMAVVSALVFALQMLNFPVAGGTSGHFAGGAAAAILLGPWPAVIVMTTVLLVQALVFADGGLLALGANVLNMAVLAPFVGYALWRAIIAVRASRRWRMVGAFVAAWAACVAAALAAGLEIWLSGNANFWLITGAMGFWHAIIGIGEGLITAGLIAYVLATRPDLIERPAQVEQRSVRGVAVVLGVVALIATGLSFLASSHPDGLEYVYFEMGIGRAVGDVSPAKGPIPDYVIPGMNNETVAGVLAGVVGLVVTSVLLYAIVSSARKRKLHTAKRD
ncbi:MAG: energy-coupling factor ABC transporter permease [Coriobacteriia bacterium]|nr:energy-coupling factor ABC transporter permease [Coriobacteriia bacterium]